MLGAFLCKMQKEKWSLCVCVCVCVCACEHARTHTHTLIWVSVGIQRKDYFFQLDVCAVLSEYKNSC